MAPEEEKAIECFAPVALELHRFSYMYVDQPTPTVHRALQTTLNLHYKKRRVQVTLT